MRLDVWGPRLLLLAIAVVARAQTFGNPVIGFDEQWYLLVGDRLLHGALPFVDIFDRKPIGLFLLFAGARLLGGEGFVQYKLVALGFVAMTAWLIHTVGRRRARAPAALIAAAFYIIWLNFMEGEGGQAPVFYNLPMMAAAAMVVSAISSPASPRPSGAAAMVLVGLAMQIKGSVVFEGVYFGCWLMAVAWARGQRGGAFAVSVGAWIGCALVPTAVAVLTYAALGHLQAFVFANVLSVLAQGRGAAGAQIGGAALIGGILAAPLALALGGARGGSRERDSGDPTAFLLGWLGAAIGGVVLYWRFASPHYALPVLLPIAGLLAPALDADGRRRSAGMALIALGLVGGQIVLALSAMRKGGAREAALVAEAAAPRGAGCIYVYDGYPALYMLTHSCLPTRWAFPGHLNTAEEARPAALGVDPSVEVRRILATEPVTIVDDFPRFAGGNPVTHRLLQAALDGGYTLAACVHTGPGRVRLVYRRRSEHRTRGLDCPDDAVLRRGR